MAPPRLPAASGRHLVTCASFRLNCLYQRSHFRYIFLLRDVFTVKTREKTAFVWHMRKTPLHWGSAECQTPKERRLGPSEAQKRQADVAPLLRATAPPATSARRSSGEGKGLACVSSETDGYTSVAFFVLEKNPLFSEGVI